MTTLTEESGIGKLTETYYNNYHKNWTEWLRITTLFSKRGKQGIVGLVETTPGILDKDTQEGDQDTPKTKKPLTYVFKLSQYINYLVYHELTVLLGLNEISSFCPHFCQGVGATMCLTDPTMIKKENPFLITEESKYLIEKEILLMEYLPKSYKFCNYINSKKIDEPILYSTIKQVLLAITIAQNKKKFTHYDLHSNNVMMRRCSKNLVFLYVMDEENQYCVPTHGHYPVIIDFGFSYIGDMIDQPLWQTLNHTDVGFTSDRFDPIADPKLFLLTTSDEIREARRSKNSRKLANIARNNYGCLPVDFLTGWDTDTEKSAGDRVASRLEKVGKLSPFFSEYIPYCIDIIQTLITIPLKKRDYKDVDISYKTFLKEFSGIENQIGTPFYCLYILKGIVDSARVVRQDYINKDTRTMAVDFFKTSILERIDSVSSFAKININYEKMLCSLYCLAKNIEGIMYEELQKRTEKKRKLYSSIPLKTPEECYGIIENNIQDDYVFNNQTEIMVINCITNSCDMFKLEEEEIRSINSYTPLTRGTELYKIFSYNKCHLPL